VKVGGDDAVRAGFTGADFEALPRQEITAGEEGINAGDQDLARASAAAWAALERHNLPPSVFRFAGGLVRLERGDSGRLVPVPLTVDRLRHHMARISLWYMTRRGRSLPAYPPVPVMRDLLAQPNPPVPGLERIVSTPILDEYGVVRATPGYVESARVVIDLAPGLDVRPVSDRPIDSELVAARRLLLEVLTDFPFAGDADRAHAVAAMLQPFWRERITGPTPLMLIDKPTPGTGGTLLVNAIGIVATGAAPPATTEGRDEDEWRKRLTAKLVSGAEVFHLDNVRRRLDTSQLASVLTADVWEDRTLGHSEVVRIPVRCLFLATGNNVALSGEIARRTVSIRLDARSDRPWLRNGFRHPDLCGWVRQQRGDLIWAALTLWRAWVVAGAPEGAARLGMFERWAAVMGGLLEVAGVPGFLANLTDLYDRADEEGNTWRRLVAAWWETHGTQPVGVADLWAIVQAADLDLGLGDGSERSQRTRLGRRLGQARDRQFDGYRIVDAGTLQRAQQFRLVETAR
jgi:hypothetical protein